MKRILILDDNDDILTLVKTILGMNGHAAETIANWECLHSTIEAFKPHLLFVDISLPGINGVELCKDLKRADKTKDIPVILFSANAETKKKVTECGAAGYLAKPFTIKELLAVIDHHTKGNNLSPAN